MKRADARLLAVATIAVAALPLSFAPASAVTLCKSAPVTGVATTEDGAIQSWSQQTASNYGSAWSNFSLAKNKQYSQQNLGLAVMNFVTADPCRNIVFQVAPINPNLVKKP